MKVVLPSDAKADPYKHQRAWRERNKEALSAYQKEYRKSNRERLLAEAKEKRASGPTRVRKPMTKDQIDHVAQYQREYLEKNADRVQKRGMEYREKNKDVIAQKKASYYEQNPHQIRAANSKRRALLLQAEGSFTQKDVDTIIKSQKYLCIVCHCKLATTYEVDHIVPLSAGGTNLKTNLQVLCKPCNRSKGAKDPIAFMQARGFLL